jgi:NarL family two-component system response regulator LiaR
MARSRNGGFGRRLRILAGLAGFGVATAAGVVALSLAEYRFLAVERSVEVFVAVVASLFAAVGIWLGRSLGRRREGSAPAQSAPPAAPAEFVRDAARVAALEITPRELEILELVAEGLSNREIGDRLFVSENTVKSHCRRLFDKLGAKRRTQAIQIGREARLIP